jgi:hypothetical protein
LEAELLRVVVAALGAAGVPHMITGSVASGQHGQPRATRDIDMVIDPDRDAIEVLVASFPPDRFYVGDAVSALEHRDMFNIIDVTSGWKVDLIVRKDRPYSREEFSRRIPATVAGVETFLSTPEDAILSKLEWHLMSGSDTQRRDVVEMILVNIDDLDRAYLDRWACELDVSGLLQLVWDEAVAAS